MTALPLKTAISDTYPNPSNAIARAGFAQLWDAVNEAFEKPEIDVASAATCDIGAQLSTKLRITGTTTITSFGTNYRGPILLRMGGALTITHNDTTLRCPGGSSIITTSGDLLLAWPTATTSGTTDGWQIAILARAQVPAFSAYASVNQSVTSGVGTKVTLGTEEYDTNGCFASSRFTPNVAGYYHLTGIVRGSSSTLTGIVAFIAKNGVRHVVGQVDVFSSINDSKQAVVDALVFLNGTTDYVELYGQVSGGTPTFSHFDTANTSRFAGYLARRT